MPTTKPRPCRFGYDVSWGVLRSHHVLTRAAVEDYFEVDVDPLVDVQDLLGVIRVEQQDPIFKLRANAHRPAEGDAVAPEDFLHAGKPELRSGVG